MNINNADEISTTTTRLPEGYMEGGFMDTEGIHRFLKRDYIDRFPKELAISLTTGIPSLTASAFRSAFLRDAKKLLRSSCEGAKLSTAATMQVQAIKLVSQKKAPSILIDMFAAIIPSVTNAETFDALYVHLDSIYTFMLQNQQQKPVGN